MLRVNQLSGFGSGIAAPSLLIASGTASTTNNPSLSVDLGPSGVKQVLVAFACRGNQGNDPWAWGTGSVGGEAFTYEVPGLEETAGNGSTLTGGATIRSRETTLSGPQTVTIPINGYASSMTETAMLVLVVRGFSATPIAYDGGDNETGSNGDDFTISTVGARIVIGGAAAASAPGNFQGPGTEVTEVAGTNVSVGYDLLPAGGASDVYSFTGGKYIIAGASFG